MLQNGTFLNLEVFNFISKNSWNMVIPTLKTCYFEASEDIITKFKSQTLHIIRIKYWKASGSSNPPSLIPALQKITIVYLHSYFLLDRRFISSNKTKTWLSSDSIQYFCAWCTYISFINNNADMTSGYCEVHNTLRSCQI